MGGYQRGAKRELDVIRQFREQSYFAVRSAGSHGEADIIALRPNEALLVQVKTDRAGPFAHFGPSEREELLNAAVQAGAKALLIHWPPDRKGPRWYWPHEWPGARKEAA